MKSRTLNQRAAIGLAKILGQSFLLAALGYAFIRITFCF